MPDMTGDLNGIGAALAAAASGSPVALSEHQRTILASTPTADVLLDIARHTPDLWRIPKRKKALDPAIATNSLSTINQQLAPIAAEWANGCRAAFGDLPTKQRIAAALTADQPLAHIADFVREDNRLASYERYAILRALYGDQGDETAGDAALPKTAYLSQLSVAGFRGIGPRAELNVAPYPGLTIVYGANGSGKSSFAEALDVLLAGTTGRFAGRGVEWRSAQTNVHKPQGGHVRGVFDLEGYEADLRPLVRSWTEDGHLTDTYDETPTDDMRALGWLDALDEFKPVLGYAELGPLLDEDAFGEVADSEFADGHETSLARHIRLRTGINDPLLSTIQRAVASNGATTGQPFLQELAAWYRLHVSLNLVRETTIRFPTNDGHTMTVTPRWREGLATLAALSGREVPGRQMLPHPRKFNWGAFVTVMNRAWLEPNPLFGGEDLIADVFARHMIAPLLNLSRDFITDEHRVVGMRLATTHGWTSRAHVYCEMLIEAIYRARLVALSKQIGDVWRRIRPGSSVHFHGIELRSVSQANQSPVFRASLDLSLDGVRGVERGILSQGELHSMALSVFLPTMTRPGSPFGFAVIDDPVQVMDEHAVGGLAEVLRDAAKDLQLIVFTHDKRLLEALRWQGIDYTQINVTRGGGSVVTCERVSDPASQRIEDARMFAEEAVADDEFRHRQNAAYQCRRAIEAACHGAVRSKFAGQGLSHQQIESKVEHALRNKDATTLRLLALAIFEDVSKQGAVRRHMKDHPEEWGEQQEIDTLAQVNALVHAVDLETAVQRIVQSERDRHRQAPDAERAEREAHAEREARAAFGRDPRDLVKDVEWLVKAIERNCA